MLEQPCTLVFRWINIALKQNSPSTGFLHCLACLYTLSRSSFSWEHVPYGAIIFFSLWNSFRWKISTPNCWSIASSKLYPSQTTLCSVHIAQLPLTPGASHIHKQLLPTFPQALHQSRNPICSNLSNLLVGILSNTLHQTLLHLICLRLFPNSTEILNLFKHSYPILILIP